MIHPILIAAIASGTAAQLYKVVAESIRERRFKLYRLFETGGMPSSHTAVVTALAVGAWRVAGFDSSLFAITLVFSLYFGVGYQPAAAPAIYAIVLAHQTAN